MVEPDKKTLWRISNYRSLAGLGGKIADGRWHTAGKPIVYLAESPAGALLEVLVHLDLEDGELPRTYNLMRIEVPDHLKIEVLSPPEGNSWKLNSGHTQTVGDKWLMVGSSALARVPSAIMPSTWNCLLNPGHPDAVRLEIVEVTPAEFDPRLLRKTHP
jgi:RES domain-containing protein